MTDVEPPEVEHEADDHSMLTLDPELVALAATVSELEAHGAAQGWEAPAQLFALVHTRQLAAAEPEFAAQLDDEAAADPYSLTPVEQDQLDRSRQIEDVLEEISWPARVEGCAALVTRLVLPPEVEPEVPEDPEEAAAFAAAHPDAEEVRIVSGATRTGAVWTAMRLRSHDDEASVITGPDLVPGLEHLVASTLDGDNA